MLLVIEAETWLFQTDSSTIDAIMQTPVTISIGQK